MQQGKPSTKRQHTEWDKIFTNDGTDKGLISKISKQVTQLNIKKIAVKKWIEDLNRHFPKEDVQEVKRYMTRCSTSLNILEKLKSNY